ncbi:MAG TPA: glutamate-1-semialdehyde 2,1-aminomutase [Thermoplasmata archaeon]|nr:glutamate-1-semialdehyde 2,1-aminomutase [Thermoplasmata archaeon]
MTRPRPRSRAAFRRAHAVLAGGVNSPVRSFAHVGGDPVFIARGSGAYLHDLDGGRYLDLLNSWGAVILGHADRRVTRAVARAALRGMSFGAPTVAEHELAERIRRAAPTIERLRFVNSGTEAAMSAIRVARGFTGRSKVVKFAGGYHGHSDGLLARAGSGVATQSLPDSAGVPPPVVADTLVAEYNSVESVQRLFERFSDSIAAVIVEPIAANMGLVRPRNGFLPGLARLCRSHGALLIADEVVTGFRVRRGLVHPTYDCRADLVVLGKVIGGGLPVGAYGGRAEVMSVVAPEGPVYQAGTLAGNPLAMAAGAAALDALDRAAFTRLERIGARVERAERSAAERAGVEAFANPRVGSMLGHFFRATPPENAAEAESSDRERFTRFFHGALDRGVYLPPSPLETSFASLAFRERELDALERSLGGAFAEAAGKAGR